MPSVLKQSQAEGAAGARRVETLLCSLHPFRRVLHSLVYVYHLFVCLEIVGLNKASHFG